jgi:hypothetical protein
MAADTSGGYQCPASAMRAKSPERDQGFLQYAARRGDRQAEQRGLEGGLCLGIHGLEGSQRQHGLFAEPVRLLEIERSLPPERPAPAGDVGDSTGGAP